MRKPFKIWAGQVHFWSGRCGSVSAVCWTRAGSLTLLLPLLLSCSSSGDQDGGEADAETTEPCADECPTLGQCTFDNGKCVATTTSGCQASTACQFSGACALGAGVCLPVIEEHCLNAFNCMKFGQCTLIDNECKPGGNDDCEQAFWCASEGYCTEKDGVCTVVKDADCAASDLCTEYQECCAHEKGYCVRCDALAAPRG